MFLLLGLLAIRVWDPLPVEIVRLKVFDFYQTLKPRAYQPLPVKIIAIDEKSLKELGQWPWPRTIIARILANTANAGGIAVAFDIVFAEADRLSPDRFGASLPQLSVETVRELEALPNNDAIMSQTMRQMRVIVGQAAASAATGDPERTEQAQTPVAVLGPDAAPYLLTYPKLLRNIDVIEQAATGRGLFSITPDWDSIVRRAALVAVVDGKIQPGLSVELLRVATGQNAFAIKTDEAGVKSVVVGGAEVPTDPNGRIWVHYTPSMPRRFISASDIANGTFDPSAVQNHLLLMGATATGLLDLKATPLDPAMPGVEVHAQILETIMGQTSLTRPNYALGAELVIAALLALLAIVFVPILGAMPVLGLGFVLAASWVGGSWYLFSYEKLLLDAFYPLFASLTVFLLLVFSNYRREEKQRQEIRSAFGQYLAPDYVEQIARNPESLALGGERRRMTILFSDVRNFTNISESFKEDPQGLTSLMNTFLTPLSNAIMERRGTIDKYMGDAIMAFWNAPLEDDNQEEHACNAALAMIERMQNLNKDRKLAAEVEGKPFFELNVGVGINTGDCVVGNMGSESRFDYSVLGDTVNLASRLEGQTKGYGITIMLGNSTAQKVKDRFAVAEIDLIRVKGKQEPERIFCLFGDASLAASGDYQSSAARLERLIDAYRSQTWDDAIAICDDLEKSCSAGFENLAAVYRDRVQAFKAVPPPADWDGVFVATSK